MHSPSPKSIPTGHTIPVLHKAIAALTQIGMGKAGGNTQTLGKQLGISQSTCYRIIQTFLQHDWVRTRAGGGFELSLGLLPITQGWQFSNLLTEAVAKPLEELASEAGLAAKVSLREADEAVVLAREEPPSGIGYSARQGARMHLAYGSSGAALLCGLEDARIKAILSSAPKKCWEYQTRDDVWKRVQTCREDGYVFDEGSFHPLVCTLSAPIKDPNGFVLAAATLMGHPENFSAKNAHRLPQLMADFVGKVEGILRHDPADLS